MTFPWIRDRVERGDLELHGWYFDIDAGELLGYSPEKKRFVSLAPALSGEAVIGSVGAKS